MRGNFFAGAFFGGGFFGSLGGVRFRRYKGGDGLEKIFPELREDEPVEVRKKERKKVERVETPKDFLIPDEPFPRFVVPPQIDFSLRSPGGADLSGLQRIPAPQVPIPPRRSDLIRMGLDEFEASSDAYLNQLMNTPSFLDDAPTDLEEAIFNG